MKFPIYLDNHATTPVDPRVFEVMRPYFTEIFGNSTSGLHAYGWDASAAVEKAREQVATLLGAHPREIIFTSGATESIHLAILGLLKQTTQPQHILTTATEHKCVLEVCHLAENLGHQVSVLPVNSEGQVELETLEREIRANTALISVIHGNNEIGSLNPIADIARLAKKHQILLHVDAAQTVGRIPLNVQELGIDLLSFSGHKLYAPKGIGALFVRQSSPRVRLSPYLVGGGQERGLRAGTHNVPAIVGLGEACALAGQLMPEEIQRLCILRDHFISRVLESVEGARLNGHPRERLCNNVSLSFENARIDQIIKKLHPKIAFSTGSACATGATAPSHVLTAIGHTEALARTTTRFGLGRFTTDAEVDFAIEALIEVMRSSH